MMLRMKGSYVTLMLQTLHGVNYCNEKIKTMNQSFLQNDIEMHIKGEGKYEQRASVTSNENGFFRISKRGSGINSIHRIFS